MVGTSPNGDSAQMLACARLRHVAGAQNGATELHEQEAYGGGSEGILQRCL